MDAFSASYAGLSEPDGFNALVMGADLGWREVSLLRAIGRYLRQGGVDLQPDLHRPGADRQRRPGPAAGHLVRDQVRPRRGRWTPRARADAGRGAGRSKIKTGLDDVASLDHDRIIRSYLRGDRGGRPDQLLPVRAARRSRSSCCPARSPTCPSPRPEFEIFVYSPRVEGVHLRFGSVARGGLRWSDRAEDFRTEILGLVKAQMVKNTVIVPVGAKGGFYGKQLPDPSVDREAWLAEGIACYKLFITSLLDVTDNIVDGEVVPPPRRGPLRRRRPLPGGGRRQGHGDLLRHRQPDLGRRRLLARRRVRLRRLGRLRPQGDGHHRPRRLGVGASGTSGRWASTARPRTSPASASAT